MEVWFVVCLSTDDQYVENPSHKLRRLPPGTLKNPLLDLKVVLKAALLCFGVRIATDIHLASVFIGIYLLLLVVWLCQTCGQFVLLRIFLTPWFAALDAPTGWTYLTAVCCQLPAVVFACFSMFRSCLN